MQSETKRVCLTRTLISLVVFLLGGSRCLGALGESISQITLRYGHVVDKTKSPTGLLCTVHRFGVYKVLVVYREGLCVSETLSRTDVSDGLLEPEMIETFLSLNGGGERWVQEPLADGYQRWSRTGARASYGMQSPQHELTIVAIQGKGSSSRVVAALRPELNAFRAPSHLSKTEDRFTGSQTIQIRDAIQLRPGLVLDCSVTKQDGQPDFTTSPVYLHFVQKGYRNSQFGEFRTLLLLVDGYRYNLGDPGYNGSLYDAGSIGLFVLEQMSVFITSDALFDIAYAHSVEARMGIVEFALPYDKREGMRQLVDEIMKAQMSIPLSPNEPRPSRSDLINVAPNLPSGENAGPGSQPKENSTEKQEHVTDGGEAP